MFLDIACFINGEVYREKVENMFNCSDHYDVTIEITDLIDKSLLIESRSYGRVYLSMHDLLREMGQAIVFDESKIPGNRSRLWIAKDVRHVLEKNKGTDAIQGILLNLSDRGIKKNVQVSPTVFSNMCHLRYLKIYGGKQFDGDLSSEYLQEPCRYNIYAPEGLFDISDELRYFRWDSCPLKYLPNFSPENLVGLIMRGSKLEKLWNEVQLLDLEKLKKIDLRDSEHLTGIPNLSGATNLEILNLQGCKNLVQIHLNLQNLRKLQILNVSHCYNLKKCGASESQEVPSSAPVGLDFSYCTRLRSVLWNEVQFMKLKKIDASYCEHLAELPNLSGAINLEIITLRGCKSLVQVALNFKNHPNLRILDLRECDNLEECRDSENIATDNIAFTEEETSSSVPVELYFSNCKRLRSIPASIGKLKYLSRLDLSKCPNLEKFPEISSGGMECLHELSLKRTEIEELPDSIENIKRLRHLSLKYCKRLKSLPQSIWKLKYLEKLIVPGCPNLQGKFPEIRDIMECLDEIDLGGTGIEELPESIENLTALTTLNLGSCPQIKFLPNSLCKLSSLVTLNLKECSSLEELPCLPLGLVKLNINYCESLKSIQQFPSSLSMFEAAGCTSIKTISSCESAHIHNLTYFRLLFPMFWRFENCMDLDHNTRNHIIADTAYNRVYGAGACPFVDIVYPGDEIPKWFNNARTDDGNSINFRLPLNWFKYPDSQVFFVVCIVGVLNNFDDDDHDKQMRIVALRYNIKTETNTSDGCLHKYIGGFATTYLQANTRNADHVFIMHNREYMCLDAQVFGKLYVPHWCFNLRKVDSLQASFSICLVEGVGVNFDIKKCGIRFIYDHDEPNVDSTSGECSDQACGCQNTYIYDRSVTSSD
ncbi:disease resistance protein RPS6-like [Ziziphus jujuba]|uniref:Disease resistance protein RPS6-like n=1 Tax=Ziziphus jujuba TaxID=326968 RepID=A0ABM4ABV6_ZIZJJ|nr:disease resistance protein RPS6-like [Ziziphus jujuba]